MTRPAFGDAFARNGYHGPERVFSPSECRQIAAYLRRVEHPAPAEWEKGRAVTDRVLYDLARHPRLLAMLPPLLGEAVVLWGACVVRRRPGAVHPWHCDMESSAPDGRFVTVWIGVEHTSRESALQVITRSHLIGTTVQEARHARGMRRELASPEAMLAAVREVDPQAELIQPDMRNGDALLFDGRLWHGSSNSRHRGERVALLLQYASADSPVRMPDFTYLDWPFRFRTAPRPPAILVSGSDAGRVNRLVPAPPPSSEGLPMVLTAIQPLVLPLEAPTQDWQPFPAFRGPTRTFTEMGCHASVLVAGHSPHPPHAHREEELLIPLHGEVELLITDGPTTEAARVERIRPGSFVYYPAGQHHTIRNPGNAPVGYLMFKWYAGLSEAGTPLGTSLFAYGSLEAPDDAPPFWTRRVFEGPTGYLGKLHAHFTVLQPGAGYDPHVDAYDVAILTLEGRVETLGQVVEPRSVIYYAAGETHGMRNVGPDPARYLVFEFHAPGVTIERPRRPLYRAAARRVLDAAKDLARPLWRRLKPLIRR